MIDHNIFDAWVDSYDVSDHTHELLDALAGLAEAAEALMTPDASDRMREVLRKMDADAWQQAYSSGQERLDQTAGREAREFFRESLGKVDNLNFEIGAFAHVLYCYASGGMVETARTDTPIEKQRELIQQWITRATRIVEMIPAELHGLQFFRLITAGAGARWALDNDRPITGDQLTALSALARQPGVSAVGAYERTRKTVQNMVAEALGRPGGSAIEVGANRLVSPKSAIAWLHEQAPDYFPSIWAMPEPAEGDEADDELAEYVLVPVAHSRPHLDAKPFTPDARCKEGYIIGRSSTVIADYWDALDALRQMRVPRFRHPMVSPVLGTLPCEEAWVRVLKTDIDLQLSALAEAQELDEGPSAQLVGLIERDPRFRPHDRIGHSSKLLRFQSARTGKAIAVEKRKGAPVLYVSKRDGEGLPAMASARVIGSAPSGRNSNLNSIPSFRDEELLALRPASATELDDLLDHLAAASGI